MSLVTNWGYTMPNTEQLPGMLTVEEFNTFTAGRYTSTHETRHVINVQNEAFHVSPHPFEISLD